MRRLLAASLVLAAAAPALAQTSYSTVVEPVPAPAAQVITAPIEYDSNGVVKAQYFKAEDLSPEQLQALLDEADRVRSYQQSNGIYVRPETAPTQPIEIELYAQPDAPAQTAELTVIEEPVSAARSHTVVKGDTLYNISKRYDVSVTDLQKANGIAGSAISLGQTIVIPGPKALSLNMTQPSVTFASAPQSDGYVTRRIVEPVESRPAVREVTSAADTLYAVLPKDTLYAISRRTCVKVQALIAANGIADANALKPGQKLTIPAGHCLTH